ncbi:MAG: LapA family protein [Acidaminobacteraceae bacterium]
MQFTIIFSLIFAVLVAIFALVNRDMVTVDIFFTQFQTPQAVVILGSAFLGAILIYLLGVVKKIKSGFKYKELEKKIKVLTLEMGKITKELEDFKSENIDLMDENNQLKEKLENTAKIETSSETKEETKEETKDESETKIDITK